MIIEFEQKHEFYGNADKVLLDTNKIISIQTYFEEIAGNEEFIAGFLINGSFKVPYIFYEGIMGLKDAEEFFPTRKAAAKDKLNAKLEEIKNFMN